AKPHQEPLGMCCGGRGRLACALAKRRHASGAWDGHASARLRRHLVYVIMHAVAIICFVLVANLLWTKSVTKWAVSYYNVCH
ncbi:hypothetical protein COCVIDRAFT_83335, partial [Bipolaris victoriae FI3]